MSEQNGQFRSAAFGGYHRQDVLDYIETMTTEKNDLEKQRREAAEGRDKAESELAACREALLTAEEEKEAMRSELEKLRGELEERTASLSQAEERIAALQEQVEQLKPGAESWNYIKDRAGDIEISAHERAQVTIRNANEQAAEIHAEGVKWVKEIQSGCGQLQDDLKTSICAAEAELDGIRSSFSRAEEEMQGFRQALSALLHRIEGFEPNAEEE